MHKKHNILHVLKIMYDIGHRRKRSNYAILGSLCFCAGCLVFFTFAFLLTALDTYAWLIYGAMGMGIVVQVLGIIWLIRDAVKQIKSEERDKL